MFYIIGIVIDYNNWLTLDKDKTPDYDIANIHFLFMWRLHIQNRTDLKKYFLPLRRKTKRADLGRQNLSKSA